MGTWGPALFSDDLAADLRGDFRDRIGDGLTTEQAAERLTADYRGALDDPDDGPVFWLALAAVQWALGRIHEPTRQRALAVIRSGTDLARWDDARARRARQGVLERLDEQLNTPPPPPKHVRRRIREANDWAVGEVVAFRLLSGNWTLFRTLGHHTDKGSRYAVCELLDSVTPEIPSPDVVAGLSVRLRTQGVSPSPFMFVEPRTKADRARVVRLGVLSPPEPRCGGFTVVPWPHADALLRRLYGVE